MNALNRVGRRHPIPSGMFAYGCATAIAAAVWQVWAGRNGGFTIQPRDGWLTAVVFAAYIAPFALRPNAPPARDWAPLFCPTAMRIAIARGLLFLGFVNMLFWPLFMPQLFALVLPSFALLSALFNALKWALGVQNIYPGSGVRFWSTGGPILSGIARPVLRALRRAPKISFEEWFSGIAAVARLISSEYSLRLAWIDKDQSVTTIADYVELHAEIFVQLESERCLKAYGERLSEKELRALRRFLDVAHRFDETFNSRPVLRDPKVLLGSAEWELVRKSAANLTGC